MYRAALLALLLVLAGCQGPGSLLSDSPTDTPELTDEPGATEPQEPTDTTEAAPANEPTTRNLSDPDEDRLGWENGYWANETIAVNNTDGLNESEREAVVGRSMARIETVRQREFNETVPVSVIDRSTYQNRTGSNATAALRTFDNAKFEALFLVGETADSIAEQETARGQSVLGYYSVTNDEIVLVSDSETPQLDGEATLAHELVHALQDQQLDIENRSARTRDAVQGQNGIIEGDASYVEQRYMARCGEDWSCLDEAERDGGGGGGDTHLGINFLMFFPYSDGPGFVDSRYEEGGWDAVDAAFEDQPDGAVEVIYPERYSEWEPVNVSLADRSTDEWERVRPPGRPDYAVVGPSAIVSSLAYTVTDDYNRAQVVSGRDIVNVDPDGDINESDPYNYDIPSADGWAGGRMHVFENDDDELAYVWRTQWENESEAREFASTWERVVQHWGGQRASGDVWLVEDGPYEDAIRIDQSGDTVTIVNAPSREGLSDVHDA